MCGCVGGSWVEWWLGGCKVVGSALVDMPVKPSTCLLVWCLTGALEVYARLRLSAGVSQLAEGVTASAACTKGGDVQWDAVQSTNPVLAARAM